MQPSEKCYGISSAISVMRSVLSGRGCRCCVAMDQLSWQPNAISCSSAINACVKGHEWQIALALVDTRRLAILNPNAINYATAASGCEGMAEWQRVLALLTDMDWLSLKSHSGGCMSLGSLLRARSPRINCFNKEAALHLTLLGLELFGTRIPALVKSAGECL